MVLIGGCHPQGTAPQGRATDRATADCLLTGRLDLTVLAIWEGRAKLATRPHHTLREIVHERIMGGVQMPWRGGGGIEAIDSSGLVGFGVRGRLAHVILDS